MGSWVSSHSLFLLSLLDREYFRTSSLFLNGINKVPPRSCVCCLLKHICGSREIFRILWLVLFIITGKGFQIGKRTPWFVTSPISVLVVKSLPSLTTVVASFTTVVAGRQVSSGREFSQGGNLVWTTWKNCYAGSKHCFREGLGTYSDVATMKASPRETCYCCSKIVLYISNDGSYLCYSA